MRHKAVRTLNPGLLLALILVAHPLSDSLASAQARDTVASLRTRYNTVRTQANPQGDRKSEFDALEREIARAARLGRTGEVRRLYTKGITLAQGNTWTPALEFASSLALRTERVFIDPRAPVAFRLEQIFLPSLELEAPLTVRVALHRPGGTAGAAGEKLKDVAAFDGVPRDLIDNPFRFDVDLSGVPDGRLLVRVETSSGTRPLATTTLNVQLHKGLDERLRRLESDAARIKALEQLRAEALYPGDYIRNVDRGRIGIGQFNVEQELATAERALASLLSGVDPFAGRTGDLKRHYVFEEAGEILPYRLYIPSTYKAERPYPLVIALHGNGGTENTFFDGFDRQLPMLAEQRGYIVAAPLGYRIDGGYGYNNGSRAAEEARKLQLSEKDVMNVLALLKQHYRIDDARIYLTGHSMGGSGTWYLGPRSSQIWAALAPFAGGVTIAAAPQIKDLPQFVVHGDADATAPVQRSRDVVAELKRLGAEHRYVEVPGGTHGNVVAPNLPAMFDFFDRHRKRTN